MCVENRRRALLKLVAYADVILTLKTSEKK
jgi:hypothetical protein